MEDVAGVAALVDASLMIALAEIGRLELFREAFHTIGIGPEVGREVVEQGRSVDVAGVRHVEAGLRTGWIQVIAPTADEATLMTRLVATTRLGAGEAEVIALANSRSLPAVLDDKEARTVAGLMGVRYLGTLGVVLATLRRGTLTGVRFEDVVRELTSVLWLGPDVVAEVLRRAREWQ